MGVRSLGGGRRGRVGVGGMPQTHSQIDLSQMHKTLADPAVNLSRSFKLVRVLGGGGRRGRAGVGGVRGQGLTRESVLEYSPQILLTSSYTKPR